MRTMFRPIVLAALSLAACGRNGASVDRVADTGPPPPGDAAVTQVADAQGTTMNTTTFHVRSNDDLNIPLAKAVAEAQKAGVGELRILIAPGTYAAGINLDTSVRDDKTSYVIEAEGGRVVLKDGVQLAGKAVTLRGITIDGGSAAATFIDVWAFERLEIDGLVLIDGSSGSSEAEKDPLIQLTAGARGATAVVKNLWVVDNRGTGPVVEIPQNGKGRWASVELSGLVLAGNDARYGIKAEGTDALTIRDAFIAEPKLAHAALLVATYGPIAISDTVVAARHGLAEYLADMDDAPKVKVANSELLGPTKKERIDAEGVTFGKAPAATLDTAFVAAAAREGKAPDRAALRAQLP